ncbi:MAG: hypothetical protein M1825_005365 [Sarcosagium campestre]|nr:MAG: hypothetical protein M1825_005365 [Sarcosagium campestre]
MSHIVNSSILLLLFLICQIYYASALTIDYSKQQLNPLYRMGSQESRTIIDNRLSLIGQGWKGTNVTIANQTATVYCQVQGKSDQRGPECDSEVTVSTATGLVKDLCTFTDVNSNQAAGSAPYGGYTRTAGKGDSRISIAGIAGFLDYETCSQGFMAVINTCLAPLESQIHLATPFMAKISPRNMSGYAILPGRATEFDVGSTKCLQKQTRPGACIGNVNVWCQDDSETSVY